MPRRNLNGHTIAHLVQSAIDGRAIFDRPCEKGHLLRLLREESQRRGVEIFAYAVMKNHYHLIARARSREISAFMQGVNRRYAIVYNRYNRRYGPLFKGRFNSYPIFTLEYAADRSFYVHLNAVESRAARRPELYRWSSAAAYAGSVAPPRWLHTGPILSIFSRARDQALAKYAFAQQEFQKSRTQEAPTDVEEYELLAS